MLRFAITQGTLTGDGTANNTDALVRQAAGLTADFLLVREKKLNPRALPALCRRLQAVTRARVLVSSRADVALTAGLTGVHLTAAPGELTVAQVRSLGIDWVSVSCHRLAEVQAAEAAGADAVLFGPVFGKTMAGRQVTPPLGLDALRLACQVGVPVFALGGVTNAHTASCQEAGAAGIAGIRLFFA